MIRSASAAAAPRTSSADSASLRALPQLPEPPPPIQRAVQKALLRQTIRRKPTTPAHIPRPPLQLLRRRAHHFGARGRQRSALRFAFGDAPAAKEPLAIRKTPPSPAPHCLQLQAKPSSLLKRQPLPRASLHARVNTQRQHSHRYAADTAAPQPLSRLPTHKLEPEWLRIRREQSSHPNRVRIML